MITGPSGVGKGTLIRTLLERIPDLELSVSATTRSPRPGERDGVDYHFVDAKTFAEMVEHSEFAEHADMVLSRDQLLERVWGYDYLGDSRLVDAHVRRLRVKVEDQPEEPTLILTVRGIGYRLHVPTPA